MLSNNRFRVTECVPFTQINAYNVHDVSEWRDLNLKFILQVMRDHRLLRAHSAPFGNERCLSLAFIDEVRDGNEDLYTRCTQEGEPAPPPPHEPPPTPPTSPTRGVAGILELLYRSDPPSKRDSASEAPCHRDSVAVWDARRYLEDMYPQCVALLRRAVAWDKDGDGLIENGGFPDQTYDAWIMTGPR